MRNRRHAGLSLVELLIAIALFGLISTYIAALVRYGFTYLQRAQDRAELQRVSLFLLSRLSSELSESSPDCLRYSGPNEAPGLVFASPRGEDDLVSYSDNRLLWKKWVAVWWDRDRQQILRAESTLPTPTLFKPDPSPAGFDVSVTSLTSVATQRVLARNVSGFEVRGDREVSVSLEVEVNQGPRRSKLTTRTGIHPHH